MSRLRASIFFVILIAAFHTSSFGQEKLLTIDDVVDPAARVKFNGNPPAHVTWLDQDFYLAGGEGLQAGQIRIYDRQNT